MVSIPAAIGTVVLAYLIGSIPVGLVVVRVVNGQDIRTVGSGRTGGTNAMRAAGPAAGVVTALWDIAKGFLAVCLPRLLLAGQGIQIVAAACAIAAVAGHNWPVYLGFKGGAGTSPNVGAAVAFWPLTGVMLIPFGALVLFATGYASVTSTVISLTIVVIFVLRAIFAHQPVEYVGYSLATFILVAVALIPNYRRLIAGTERIVGPRAKVSAERGQAKG